jgi:MraZ protein
MASMLGTYEVTLDPKGRFMIPSAYKKLIGETECQRFILNCGIDKCLSLYTEKQWASMEAIVSQLNDFNEKARRLKRQIMNGVRYLEPDAAGRLLIPKDLLQYAGITKDILFTSQLNKMELWDVELYRKATSISSDDFNTLSGEVLGGDFTNPFFGTT